MNRWQNVRDRAAWAQRGRRDRASERRAQKVSGWAWSSECRRPLELLVDFETQNRGFQEGEGQILFMKGGSGAVESGWDWKGRERQWGLLGVYSSLPGKRWRCFGSGLERRLRRCFVSRAKLLGHVVLKNKFFLTNWLNNMQLFSMAKISKCRQLNMIQLNFFSKSLWHLCFLKDEVIKKTTVNSVNRYNSVCRA